MSVILDYEKDKELFDKTAEHWAEKISKDNKPTTENNQIRNFYEYVLKYYDRVEKGDNFDDILPFVKMLNSKVAYAQNRSKPLVNATFVEMITSCISQIKVENDFRNFKSFFESVIGFYYKFNKKDSKEQK